MTKCNVGPSSFIDDSNLTATRSGTAARVSAALTVSSEYGVDAGMEENLEKAKYYANKIELEDELNSALGPKSKTGRLVSSLVLVGCELTIQGKPPVARQKQKEAEAREVFRRIRSVRGGPERRGRMCAATGMAKMGYTRVLSSPSRTAKLGMRSATVAAVWPNGRLYRNPPPHYDLHSAWPPSGYYPTGPLRATSRGLCNGERANGS